MRRLLPLLALCVSATTVAAQGFCADLSGPDLDGCRRDYYQNVDGILTIVYRRALDGMAAPAQTRLRQEQTAWAARRRRLSGVTPQRPQPVAAKLDTLIVVTQARISELGQAALVKAPWLVGIFPEGATGGDSLAEAISMRNDVWRFATWQEQWVHAGNEAYAGQDEIRTFRPTTGHAITVLFASADGWSAIVTSDASSTLCGMYRGDIDAQDPNLEVQGVVTCW